MNDNFAKLAEALYVAEKKAREDIESRAKVRQQVSRRQQEQKEMEFRNLAAAARDRRSLVGAAGGAGAGASAAAEREAEDDYEPAPSEADLEAKDRRDQVRAELKREREREARVERAKKSKLGHREEERDVSEAIALGKALPKSCVSSHPSHHRVLLNSSHDVFFVESSGKSPCSTRACTISLRACPPASVLKTVRGFTLFD